MSHRQLKKLQIERNAEINIAPAHQLCEKETSPAALPSSRGFFSKFHGVAGCSHAPAVNEQQSAGFYSQTRHQKSSSRVEDIGTLSF